MSRVKTRGLIAGISGVLAGILLIICFMSIGWFYWSIDISAEGENVDMTTNFGLSEGEVEIEGMSETSDYDDGDGSESTRVFDLVWVLVLISMILAFAFGTLGILAGVKLVSGWIPLLLGMITAMTVLAGPIYLMTSLPDAMQEDIDRGIDEGGGGIDIDYVFQVFDEGPWDSFWGSGSSDTEMDMGYTRGDVHVDHSWGPNWCWYLTIFLGLVFLVSGFMCIGIKRKPLESSYYSYPSMSSHEKWAPNPHQESIRARRGSSYEEEYESLYGPQKIESYYYDDEPFEEYFHDDGFGERARSERDDYFAEVVMMDVKGDRFSEEEAMEVEPFEE